jgi:hypothetical protein
MNKTLILLAVLLVPATFQAASAASLPINNVVRFGQGSDLTVGAGAEFSVDVIGENFTKGPDGASFSLSWDPTVLSFVSYGIANPPWDASYIFEDHISQGLIDYVFLAKTSPGDAGANFNLASFTFDVIGQIGAATALTLGLDSYQVGFVSPGGVSIPGLNFVDAQVAIAPPAAVPLPATVWTIMAGLPGLLRWQRREQMV